MRSLEILRSLRRSSRTASILIAAALVACVGIFVLSVPEDRFPGAHIAIALACVGVGATFGFLVREIIARQCASTETREAAEPAAERVRRVAVAAQSAATLSARQVVEATAVTEGLNAFSVEFRAIVRALEGIATQTDVLAASAAPAPARSGHPVPASALAVEELCLLTRHASFAAQQIALGLEVCIRRNAESASLSADLATHLHRIQPDARHIAPCTLATPPPRPLPAHPTAAADPVASANDLIAQSHTLLKKIDLLLDLAPPTEPFARPTPPSLPRVRPNHPTHPADGASRPRRPDLLND